jgi:FkbM family methyltransferase
MGILSLNATLLVLSVISFLVATHMYLLQEADQELEKEQQLLKEVHGETHKTIDAVTTVRVPTNSQQTSFPTVHCPTVLAAAKAGQLGFKDPNHGLNPANYTRLTVEDPKFKISLHNKVFDPVRWCIMDYGRYYERDLVKIWRQALLTDYYASNETIVLDVGGNIGFFSLFSLSLSEESKQRIRVHTFEPNPMNNLRHCESLELNDWHHPQQGGEKVAANAAQKASIVIHPIGVSQQNGEMSFILAPGANPGTGHFETKTRGRNKKQNKIMVITLDNFARRHGWLDDASSSSSRRAASPNIAILKIDVEALEPEVVLGAKELIGSRLVRNIFVEVTVKNDLQWKACEQALEVIIHAGYHLAGQGGYLGPGKKSPWLNDEHLITNILSAAKTENSKQLNLWWVPVMPQ